MFLCVESITEIGKYHFNSAISAHLFRKYLLTRQHIDSTRVPHVLNVAAPQSFDSWTRLPSRRRPRTSPSISGRQRTLASISDPSLFSKGDWYFANKDYCNTDFLSTFPCHISHSSLFGKGHCYLQKDYRFLIYTFLSYINASQTDKERRLIIFHLELLNLESETWRTTDGNNVSTDTSSG
jgi:hypothetical protein